MTVARRRRWGLAIALALVGLGVLAGAGALDGSGPRTGGGDGGSPAAGRGDGELEVHFIDAGQGDATLLRSPAATVLVDTGRHTATDVVDYLRDVGVETLDVVAVTHPHADHLGQFPAILDAFDVAEVWWSPAVHTTRTFERSVAALEASDAAFEEPRAGERTDVGGLVFEFVNPGPAADGADLHDTGLAFRVSWDEVAFVFTGDAEQHTEERMVRDHAGVLAADVFQAGHHGSATSTSAALLDAVEPSVVVWSAGRDSRYGHPHEEVLDRLAGAGVDVYGTALHGTVVVTTDGSGLQVTTERGGPPAADAR